MESDWRVETIDANQLKFRTTITHTISITTQCLSTIMNIDVSFLLLFQFPSLKPSHHLLAEQKSSEQETWPLYR